MYFSLIDRIESFEVGKTITATKSLSMAEEYLRDHFPNFPVMPGVLMLEAMTQTAAWLIRISEDFAHSLVLLKEAKNVKYGKFVQPGQTLTLRLQCTGQDDYLTTFKAEGLVEGTVNVRATLILARYNLADRDPTMKAVDSDVVAALRNQLRLLWYPKINQTV